MAAKFTSKIHNFIANSLIDSLEFYSIPKWQSNIQYNEGDQVFNDNKRYIAKNTATSGNLAPTHVWGTGSDGNVFWIFIEYYNLLEGFSKNVYVSVGKNNVWKNENQPDPVYTNDLNDYKVIQDSLFLARVYENNFRLAIKRNQWNSGNVYSQYDSEKDPLSINGDDSYDHPFYVITDENKIYKCLNNCNDSESTIKPTETSIIPFLLGDGYVWKFMGIVASEVTNFMTNEFISVYQKKIDDNSLQWDVQESAIKQSISTFKILNSKGSFSGSTVVDIIGGNPTTPAQAYITKNSGSNTIKQILVNPSFIGEGYDLSKEVYAIIKEANAQGSDGAVGEITVTNGVITNLEIANAGQNYQNGAIILLYDPNGNVTQEANITVQLTGSKSIQQFNIINGGVGYSQNVKAFIIPGTNGAIGKAIFAPKEGHGYNIVTELCANTVIINVKLTDETEYLLTGEQNAFRQVALVTDIIDKNTQQTATHQFYAGPCHPNYNSPTINKIDKNAGYVLYVNNVKKVIRNNGQEENIRIAITF